MYVKNVSLRKIRGFKSLRLDFTPRDDLYAGLTVITGSNGSGKTTLLRAIAASLLGPNVATALQGSFKYWVSAGETRGTIQTEIVPSRGADRFEPPRVPFQPFPVSLQVSGKAGEDPRVSDGGAKIHSSMKHDPRYAGPWGTSQLGWFCAGYGAFRRLSRGERSATEAAPIPARSRPFNSLFFTGTTLNECEAWLKDLDYRSRYSPESGIGAKELLQSTMRFLNDGLLPGGLQISRVDPDGAWLARADGTELPLAEMSDGERTSLALVMDILRHMETAYGGRGLFGILNGRTVVTQPGVVLIDELDAHLHPEWQLEIGPWLKKAFPKIQFIVTTHSPMICQAADKDSLYHLQPSDEPEGVRIEGKDYQETVSSRPNDIYTGPAFKLRQLRPSDEEERRQEFAQLSAKKASVPLTPAEIARFNDLAAAIADNRLDDDDA